MDHVMGTAPVDEVRGSNLMQHCAGFAQWVKLSGTPDELSSLKTVQAALDGCGYRTKLILHDAYISLPGAASVVIDGVAVTAITHSFSKSSAGLTAPVIDLGGGSAAEFAGQDIAGKIVLTEGIASPAVAALCVAGGAAGQLHISPHEHLHEMCISPVWGSPGTDTLGQMPATVACTISQADGQALRARLAAGEAPKVMLKAAVETGWCKTPILQADADGPDPAGPFVLFSGHHDTWYYGVMDNGSANATMLEVARVMIGHRAEWRRNLRLCFWSGHSHGRYSSSTWYVDQHWDELARRCAVHVNVDSTGGIGASVMTESATASELSGLAADVIRQETNAAHKGKRSGRNSDMSFWGVGIPAMFGSLSHQPPSPAKMRNALGWWWHTPQDLLDKIDEANLVRDTRVFVRTFWRLLTEPVLPLDYATHAEALLAELGKIAGTLGEKLSLAPLAEAAAALRDEARIVLASGAAPEAINRALMGVSRALVPMDYTSGDRFAHDPALPQGPWPVLDPVRALAKAEGDAAKFAAVDAVRARNRVLFAVQEARRALAEASA